MNEEQYIDELIDAGATDEEIVEALVLFRERQTSPPGKTEVVPSETRTIELPENPHKRTDDIIMAGISGLNRGVSRLVSGSLKLLGAADEALSPDFTPEQEQLLFGGPRRNIPLEAGQAVEDFSNKINYRYENVNQTFQDVAEGAGQAAGMMATAGAGAAGAAPRFARIGDDIVNLAGKVTPNLAPGLLPATGRAVSGIAKQVVTPTGFLGGAVTAVPEWEAAKAAGLSDDEAFNTLIKNYLVGQTDAIPITNFLSRWNKITNGSVMERVRQFGTGGLQEFLQEGFQTYLTNQIAKKDYDPDRDPMFQVLESASVGGMVGLLFPGIATAMGNASPQVREKLARKKVILEANAEIAKSDTGDPAVNAAIDNQTDETTNTLTETSEEKQPSSPSVTSNIVDKTEVSDKNIEQDPVTLTETSFPIYDEQGNETGRKPAKQFSITLPGVGDAKGTIVGNQASILEIFAEKDEEGNAKKGGGLYGKVIDNLKKKGVKQIVVGLQSPASTAALQGMVRKGTLSVAPGSINKGETDMHGNPIRFNIESDLVSEFDQTGVLLGGAEESKSATKAAATEQIADFLRGKVKSRGEVTDFADSWNLKHPERPITDAEVRTAWDLIRPAKADKGEVITTPVNELLKDQIKTFYRGVEKGVRKGQKLVNENLIPKVQEALKGAKLTPRQTSAILTKLKNSNLFTAGSQSRLNTFIDKVVGDAQYAEKLAEARSLQTRVRKFGRQKSSSAPISVKVLARSFGKINPTNVEDIDQYIAQASDIVAAFRPSNSENYKMVTAADVEDYIDKQRTTQEEQQEKELKESEENKTFEELRTVAKLSAERLAEKDLSVFDEAGRKSVETIKKLDLDALADNELGVAFLRQYVKTVDNIVENNDLSNEAAIEAMAAAQDFMVRFQDTIAKRKTKTSNVGTWGRVMNNMSNLMKRIYQDQSVETMFREYIQKLAHAGSKREKAFFEIDKTLDAKIKAIEKRYRGSDLRSLDSQLDFEVFYLFKQMGDPSEVAKMHRNIKAIIDRHSRDGNDEEAAAWQQAYKPYESVTSSEETDTIVEKKNPAAKELWSFFREQFTDEMSEQSSRVAREVYNREYLPVKEHYLPIVQHHSNTLYRRVNKMREGTPDVSPSVNPQQARTAMKRTLNLMDQHAVYTSTPINDLILRYSETVYQNLAAKEELKLVALLSHAKLKDVVGGKENEAALIKTMDRFLGIQRGLHGSKTDNEVEEFITEGAKMFRHIGTVRALASFSQIVKQSTVTVKTWLNLLTSGDADLMIPAIHAVTSMKKNEGGPVEKLLENSTLVARSLRLGGTDRGTSEAYKVQRGARRWFWRFAEKNRIKIDKNVRRNLGRLTAPDVFNARMAFIAYYMKSLRDQGLKNEIDLNTEWQKQDTPERQKAIAFAETMIEKTQTASNAALLSEFQSRAESNWGEFVKAVFLPFSTFDADFKARLVNEVSAVRRTKSSEDLVKLGGTVGEAIAFALVSGIQVYWWKELLKKGIEFATGVEPPEKDEEDTTTVLGVDLSKKAMKKRIISSISSAINPLAIGSVPQDLQAQALNLIGYTIEKEEGSDLTKKEWMHDNAWAFEAREGTMTENLGVYSSGLSPLIELTNAAPNVVAVLGEPVTVIDAYGNEKQVRLTKEQQLVLSLKLLVESATLAGVTEADVANVVRQIYREQMRAAPSVEEAPASKSFKRDDKSFERNEGKSFKRKRKSFKRNE